MLSPNALTTLETVKSYLDDTDISDTWLEMKINAISDEVATRCRRTFNLQSYTKTVTGGTIMLEYPVVSLTVTKGGQSFTDFTLDNKNGTVHFPHGSEYVLNYTAGYVLPSAATVDTPRTLPYDLEDAVSQLVVIACQMRGSESLKSEVIGPLKSDFLSDAPEPVWNIIMSYRDVSVV